MHIESLRVSMPTRELGNAQIVDLVRQHSREGFPVISSRPWRASTNCCSCPGPGVALAWQNGQIQRGDRLAGWVGSAGMSFAAYSFQL